MEGKYLGGISENSRAWGGSAVQSWELESPTPFDCRHVPPPLIRQNYGDYTFRIKVLNKHSHELVAVWYIQEWLTDLPGTKQDTGEFNLCSLLGKVFCATLLLVASSFSVLIPS